MYLEGHEIEKDEPKALALFTKAGDQGDSHSKYYVGHIYLYGANKDEKKAFQYLEAAANEQDSRAQFELGNMYEKGLGVEKDLQKAIEWHKKSASNDYIIANYHLGNIYTSFEDDESNEEALKYFQIAANKGYADAQYKLGRFFSGKIRAEQKINKAMETYISSADKSQSTANCSLGLMYLQGKDVPQNLNKAFKHFASAAAKNKPKSQAKADAVEKNKAEQELKKSLDWFNTAVEHHRIIANCEVGCIEREGCENAIEYYKMSAKQGIQEAQVDLGSIYLHGWCGATQNSKEAIAWYTKAAKEKNTVAICNLGYMYLSGTGVDINPSMAFEKYKEAADLGNSDAQFNLGYFYRRGFGVAQSNKKSMEWYKASAKQRNVYANYALGLAYMEYDEEKDDMQAFEHFKFAADNGYNEAQLQLGYLYERGIPGQNGAAGLEKNIKEALHWYERAARYQNSTAYYNLGHIYLHGQGVDKDENKAHEYFESAATLKPIGNSDAQFELGKMHQDGQDYEKAIEWYKMAGDQFHRTANYRLGTIYRDGLGVEMDQDEALKYFNLSALQGDSDAQYAMGRLYADNARNENGHNKAVEEYNKDQSAINASLGTMHLKGQMFSKNVRRSFQYFVKAVKNGIDDIQDRRKEDRRDFHSKWYSGTVEYHHIVATQKFGNQDGKKSNPETKLALNYLEMASKGGHMIAQCDLGNLHYTGQGAKKDVSRAIKLYTKSATQNYPPALFNLGYVYLFGKGCETDAQKACEYFRRAADEDDADAQFNLGYFYKKGYHFEASVNDSLEWYTKAANQKHVLANYCLGKAYADGEDGVEKDFDKAFRCFEIAAEKGYLDAQYRLGCLYQYGHGVKQDNEAAISWYTASNNEDAKMARAMLQHTISNDTQGFEKAVDWYKESIISIHKGAAFRGIGFLYEHGDGVGKSFKLALSNYMIAQENKNVAAYYDIFRLHYYGNGVDKNPATAVKWLRKVVAEEPNDNNHVFGPDENGKYAIVSERRIHGEAHYYLGEVHKLGKGVDENPSKALKHFKLAAEYGAKVPEEDLQADEKIPQGV
jgi:TPR repeat protein